MKDVFHVDIILCKDGMLIHNLLKSKFIYSVDALSFKYRIHIDVYKDMSFHMNLNFTTVSIKLCMLQ